jgi:hypothetical protein
VPVFAYPAKARAVYLFRDGAEVRWEHARPRRGHRVRSRKGDDWIIADVLQSGADTYTVTCVAPREIDGTRNRALAYLRRDREFVLGMLFVATTTSVALSGVMPIWASLVVTAAIVTFMIFAWATK